MGKRKEGHSSNQTINTKEQILRFGAVALAPDRYVRRCQRWGGAPVLRGEEDVELRLRWCCYVLFSPGECV